jgi:hypothetical protein
LNSLEIALAQNAKRDRVVYKDILIDTHDGASATMKKIVDLGAGLKRYMDGDIFIAFNNYKVDSNLVKSGNKSMDVKTKKGKDGKRVAKETEGAYLANRNDDGTVSKKGDGKTKMKGQYYTQLKVKGKTIKKLDDINQDIIDKIVEYTPKGTPNSDAWL